MSQTPAPHSRPAEYRLHRSLALLVVGASVVVLALLVFAATVVVALTDLPAWTLLVLLGLGAIGVGAVALFLRRAWVVRCDETGYRTRMIRGAGVTQARWSEVTDAVAVTVDGVPCVRLRLRDGRMTTLPATVLAEDREQFARDIQGWLREASRTGGR